MIRLQDLPDNDREVIKAVAVSFFLSYQKSKALSSLFNEIRECTELSSVYEKEMWTIITCAVKALKCGTCYSELPMSAKYYSYVSKNHGIKLCHKRMGNLVKSLDRLGYLEYYIGNRESKDVLWNRSVVCFKDKMLSKISHKVFGMYRTTPEDIHLVEVRDSVTKENVVPSKVFHGISGKRALMKDYNNILCNSDITFFGNKCYVVYKRVFSDDLDSGGRIYTAGRFQQIRGDLRKHIKISGVETTEVDIKNMHVSMLALMQGVVFEDGRDHYTVAGHKRSVAKLAMMCIINCDNVKSAAMATYQHAKSEGYTLKMCYSLIHALLDHNAPIRFFGEDVPDWSKLQRLDSEICCNVISDFVSRKEVVLSYHDSWVTTKENRGFLIDSIQKAWKSVMNTDKPCRIEIDF